MIHEPIGIGSKIEHPKFGLGIVCNLDADFYKIYFTTLDDLKEIDKRFDGLTLVEKITADTPPVQVSDIESAVRKVMQEFKETTPYVELASKWIGGTLELKPQSDDLQSKEVPIHMFFNKIISVRERLRVLEQNINNHKSLDEAEKLHLQQYISRAYGSLTTFNVLFALKSDYFKGLGKK